MQTILSDENLPKITSWYRIPFDWPIIVAFPTPVWLLSEPVNFVTNECWMIEQTSSRRHSSMMPLTNKISWFITPSSTLACQYRVVVRETIIRSTGFRKDVCLGCEVLKNVVSKAIDLCSDIKSASRNLLAAEKSELFERHFCSQCMKCMCWKPKLVVVVFIDLSIIVCQRPIHSFWLLENKVCN